MAATTTELGLVTPTQGTLSGTWGDTVNYGITEYVNIAIAGTLSFAGDGAVTLANTTGNASTSNIGSTTAQYMVIRITGTQTVAKVITAPSYSKLYMVDHAGATSAVTFKASGQTGVSIAVGEKCFVYFNGTDYVKVASSVADGVTTLSFGSTGLTPSTATSGAVTVAGTLAPANGGTGQTSYTDGQLLIGNSTGNTLTKATLTAGTNVTITNAAGAITIAASGGGGSSQWTTSGSNIYYTTGSVGIGTATPTFATGSGLQVKDASFANVRVTGGSNTGLDISQTTSGPAYVYLRDNQPLIFGTNDTERMRVNAGAPILCLSGGSTTATGTGIAFPATQSASSNANTLDDYEEGTWTPSQGAGLTVVGSFTSQGFYTKVGNIVTVTASLFGSTSIASSTTGILCGGLPFTPAPPTTGYVVGSMTNQSGNISNTCFSLNSTNVYGAEATTANLGIHFTMTYRV